jgi:hypothetical protein
MAGNMKAGRIAVLVGLLLCVAFALQVTAGFRHIAFPVGQEQIDQAASPADRAFLIRLREKQTSEV